ncbi:SDR family oxidoreductase [Roseateles sp. P5_D6]
MFFSIQTMGFFRGFETPKALPMSWHGCYPCLRSKQRVREKLPAIAGRTPAALHRVERLFTELSSAFALLGFALLALTYPLCDQQACRRRPGKCAALDGTAADTRAGNSTQRFGTVDEIDQPIVFLASDKARYLTGQSLAVDGGMTAQ